MAKIGVIPFQIIDGDLSVLMVTSMRTGRWILPKGNLKAKESHKKGCLREAFEEAGVKGKILKNLPMTMLMPANGQDADNQHQGKIPVVFYPMQVDRLSATWPEQDQRQRKWMTLDAAMADLPSKDVVSVLNQFKSLTPWLSDEGR